MAPKSSDETSTLRITPDVLTEHARPVNVEDLTIWEQHPVDYDIGAVTVFDTEFGKPQIVFTYGNEVLLGKEQVEAERIDPKDAGQTLAVDLETLGWPRHRAEAFTLGQVTQHRTALWDDHLLAELVTGLHAHDAELAAAAGWDGDTIDELLAALDPPDSDLPDTEPGPPPDDPVTQTGDIWLLGEHRLICGDSTDITLPGDGVVVTDPPYGIDLDTDGSSRSSICVSKSFPKIAGDDQPFDPAPWLGYERVVLFGANHYADRLPASPSWIVWDKLDGLETDKRDWGFNNNADVELAWTNLGGPARIFPHRWMGICKASEENQSRNHPTQKPVALFEWIINHASDVDDTILDPYAGSGPCLLAAHNLNRKCVAVELSPAYCDVICRRFQEATGIKPVLESTGEPHDFSVEL